MTLPPIRRELLVDATPATAFELFTRDIGLWWPLERFSVYGADATVAFEGDGRILERSPDGATNVWGEVMAWHPPRLLRFTWHPGDRPAPSTVTVTFEPRHNRTLVTLEHTGWESFAQPDVARGEYEQGWPAVVERFAAHAAANPGPAGSSR